MDVKASEWSPHGEQVLEEFFFGNNSAQNIDQLKQVELVALQDTKEAYPSRQVIHGSRIHWWHGCALSICWDASGKSIGLL